MILAKLDRKDKHLKSRFCISCKKAEMSLRACWHNTVNILIMQFNVIYISFRYFFLQKEVPVFVLP